MKVFCTIAFTFLIASFCFAHMSPPVQLVSEQEAVQRLMPAGLKSSMQSVRLNLAQRDEIQKKAGWKPTEKTLRYYIGTDEQGAVKSKIFVIAEYTLHGSIRVMAACDGDGKVIGAELLEVSEEAYNWVKPLIEQDYVKHIAQGQSPDQANMGSMTKYYAEVIANVVNHAPALVEVVK